jgi:hypothetical protein
VVVKFLRSIKEALSFLDQSIKKKIKASKNSGPQKKQTISFQSGPDLLRFNYPNEGNNARWEDQRKTITAQTSAI